MRAECVVDAPWFDVFLDRKIIATFLNEKYARDYVDYLNTPVDILTGEES